MEEKKKIEFQYKMASDYKIYAISGMQGTITPTGELIINCYKERHPVPDSETYEIQENGQLSFLERSPGVSSMIIREIPFALSVNPMQARAFADWLNAKADEFEKRAVKVPDNLDG